MSVSISQGGDKLSSFLKDLIKNKKTGVDAGFFKEAVSPDGIPIAQIAIYNEYGTVSNDGKTVIPARPFMTDTAKKSPEWMKKLQGILKLQGSKINIENALVIVGEIMAGDIQKTISKANSLYTPNAPSTIKKKGKDTVLQNTSLMLNSVNYKVNK